MFINFNAWSLPSLLLAFTCTKREYFLCIQFHIPQSYSIWVHHTYLYVVFTCRSKEICMCQTLNLQMKFCFVCSSSSCATRATYIFHARWVILKRSGLRSSFMRKWLATGMPSPMLKPNQNNCKQNSPRIVASWRHPLFRASHGLMLVGGGGV